MRVWLKVTLIFVAVMLFSALLFCGGVTTLVWVGAGRPYSHQHQYHHWYTRLADKAITALSGFHAP